MNGSLQCALSSVQCACRGGGISAAVAAAATAETILIARLDRLRALTTAT
ncbi:hypothetical protein I546_3901 [Mycobacterium kansasii 732]|nr:hypothetical protein I546_3901 [Mycobacterium kansasii 732]